MRSQASVRLPAAGGREGEEVEYMVPGLRGIVVQRPFGMAYHFFEVHVFELGAFDEFIQFVDIRFLVFAVVEVDGFFGDCRFEGIVGIR